MSKTMEQELQKLFEQHDRMVQMETEAFKKSKVRKRAIVAISILVVGLLTMLIFG